ncbi:hypothetical protein [Roseateles koreensis]|uniref:Transmembrane protein n=1 Tax=Roseateles koreensis TaxID=2987526 RepID=A0ABT5KUW6_9BURK|nr:hypothetical protein [Roseateles koreensis]MDC8786627.1 hypothetical protein [Roseateles koreensis]
MLKALLAPLVWLLRLLLALIILFEEWGWVPLSRLLARLGDWPPFRAFAPWVRGLPPYAALALLVLPSLLIIPVKLLALWLIAHGRVVLGVGVIMAAKVVGTALVARLFQLIQPALMRLRWFVPLYQRWSAWKQELLAWVHAQPFWRMARVIKRQLGRRLRQAWSKRR